MNIQDNVTVRGILLAEGKLKAVDADVPISANRTGSAGPILVMERDGFSVGGLHSRSLFNSSIIFGDASDDSGISCLGRSVVPADVSGYRDALIDNGSVISRWKDGHYSGQVNCATIETSDSVGIGITPAVPLHVQKSSAGYSAIFVNTDTTGGYGLRVVAGGTNAGRNALLVEDGAGTDLLRIRTETGLEGHTSLYGALNIDSIDGTTVPLLVKKNISGGVFPALAAATVASFCNAEGNSSPAIVSVISGTNGIAGLYLGDTSSETKGRIWYLNATDTLELGANGAQQFSLGSSLLAITVPTTTTVDAAVCMVLNRTGADGEVLAIQDGGVSAGRIGTWGGDMYIGTSGTGLRFLDASSQIVPFNTSTPATNDGVISIGKSDARLLDGYFSGQVNSGSLAVSGGGTLPTLSSVTVASFLNATAISDNCFVSLISGNTGTAGFLLGDTDVEDQGRIWYSNNTSTMHLGTAGATRVSIDSTVAALTVPIITTVAGKTATFNTTLDGPIIEFEKNGFPIGGINVRPGFSNCSFITNPDSDGSGITGGANAIMSCDEFGIAKNGTIDNGTASFRWNNGHFAGQVNSETVFLANSTAPSTPTGGGVIYVEAGALKYKGSSGTVTTLGVA